MIDYKQIILNTTGVMTPLSLCLLYGGEISCWNNILIDLVKSNSLKLMFKLKIDELLDDYENDWVSSLGVLAKEFKIKGKLIYFDGSLPENIEVGFVIK